MVFRKQARADGGYPWSSAICVSTGKTTGSCSGYEWKHGGSVTNPATGHYYYRNCTDYAAWKLLSLGVPLSKVSGLGNGSAWDNNAPSKGLIVNTVPEVGSIAVNNTAAAGFGHVAFIESVQGSQISISEYNWNNPGGYHSRTGTPDQLGFSSFIHYEDYFSMSAGKGSEDISNSNSPSSLATASNADGRLTIFAIGNDNQVYAKTQKYKNQHIWNGWYHIPGGGKGIAATTNTDGRMQTFYVGGDGAVYYRVQEQPNVDKWLPEQRIHAGVAGPISVTRNQDGRLALFTVGTDRKVYTKTQVSPSSDSWDNWYEIPAGAQSIATSTNSDGRVEIMYVGGDGAVWSRRQRSPNGSSWYSERRIHAGLNGHIALTRQSDLRLQLFARGTDNKIYENTQTIPSSWSWDGWGLIPAGVYSVTANSHADGRIFIAYVGGDGALYYRHQRIQNNDIWTSEGRIRAGLLK